MENTLTNVVVGLLVLAATASPLACGAQDGDVGRDPTVSEDQSLLKKKPGSGVGTSDGGGGSTAGACFSDRQGDPTSCKAYGTWKESASAACTARGAQLVAFEHQDACGGSAVGTEGAFRGIKYECCVAPPPPPPPPRVCKVSRLDPATSKQAASDYCAAQKLELLEIAVSGKSGSADFALEVTCCEPPPPHVGDAP
jgi:hypothetical protein